MEGCDYSSGRISGQQLKSLGIGFVCRYLSPYPAKNLSHVEVQDFNAHGISIVTVYETTAEMVMSGSTGGHIDASMARSMLADLGAPAHAPVFFAVDFDIQDSQLIVLREYLTSAAQVLGHACMGVYGGLRAVRYALSNGLVSYAWQTEAWSGGVWDQAATIRQLGGGSVGGVEVDWDQSTGLDFGQWRNELSEDQMIISGEFPFSYGFSEVTATQPYGSFQDVNGIKLIVLETANGGAAQAPQCWLSLGCEGPDNSGLENTVRVGFQSETGNTWTLSTHVLKPSDVRLSIPVPAKTGKISLSRMGTVPASGTTDPALENPIGYCVLYARQ